MRNSLIAAFAATLLLGVPPAFAAGMDDMVGKWKWTDFTIDVSKCADNPSGAGLCAKVTAGPKNVGMEMIRSKLEPQGDAFVGKIAHPLTGEIYNTKMSMSSPDTWTMDGCTDANVCAKGDFTRIK